MKNLREVDSSGNMVPEEKSERGYMEPYTHHTESRLTVIESKVNTSNGKSNTGIIHPPKSANTSKSTIKTSRKR